VTCSPEGITINTERAQTRPDGVALRITSSLPRGSYLTFKSTGTGGVSGGEPIHPGSQLWTLALSPGTITLGCDLVNQMGNGKRRDAQVTDPGGNWRGTRNLEAIGCRGSGIVDWAFGFVDHAASEKAAAEAAAHDFQSWAARAGQPKQFTVRPLAVGYKGGATQTWLLMKAGNPYATILVHHKKGHYNAGPDASCASH
jgi:hypothetical protein